MVPHMVRQDRRLITVRFFKFGLLVFVLFEYLCIKLDPMPEPSDNGTTVASARHKLAAAIREALLRTCYQSVLQLIA